MSNLVQKHGKDDQERSIKGTNEKLKSNNSSKKLIYSINSLVNIYIFLID